jgi:hypothetical protein
MDSNKLEEILDKFDKYSDKYTLASMATSLLGISKEQLIDYDYLEKRFKIELSENAKFKLKALYKADNYGGFEIRKMTR